MDTRRGRDDTQDEGGGWLLVGRHPCRPPSPEHRNDPGALFDETQKVATVKGMRKSRDNLSMETAQHPLALHSIRQYRRSRLLRPEKDGDHERLSRPTQNILEMGKR